MRDISELSDIQAESGIIGTLLYHPEYIAHCEYLEAHHFMGADNKCIYWAIKDLYEHGITRIDAFNVANKIQSNKAVMRTMESMNLPTLEESFELYHQSARSTVDEYKMLVESVVTYAFKRCMVDALTSIENDCFNESIDLDKLNVSVYNKLDKLTERFMTRTDVQTLGDQIDEIWDDIVSRRNPSGTYGIPSKYSCFNEYFSYEPGELVVIQAKYKRGKSVFLMNEVVDKLKNDIACLVLDTEMPTRQYVERLLAHLTGIEIRRIKAGTYDADEEQSIVAARRWIKEKPLIHIYDPRMTMEKLYAICKMQKRQINLGFVCYDYMKSNATSTGDNYNILGAQCDFLKNNIAGELEIPVLAACQLNRQGEVADSDKINRYLSVGIKWDYKTQEMIVNDGQRCGNAYAKIYVNRLGKQMDDSNEKEYIDFVFSGDNATIMEAEQHEQESMF